jgi:predicted GH43/DUF377 family glycosyl hydrolase
MLKPYGVPIERLNGGKPIVAPKDNWWENEATINAAAFYLERSATNDPIIKKLISMENLDDQRLENGIVAVHYRAISKKAPGKQRSRSYVGLALFTPDVELLKRYLKPLILPSENSKGYDYLGVEDLRITRIGDTFYALYCGFDGKNMRVCMTISKDLINWKKLGLVIGDINSSNNKDAVLFPEKIDGHYFMMHRPMVGDVSNFSIHLAMSDSPIGAWKNCGMVLHSFENPACKDSWVGAGSVPIPLGDKRFLVLYHTGNYLKSGKREYDADAAIFNFQNFSPDNPAGIVEKRLEHLMVPETDWEKNSEISIDIVFPEGSYEYHGEIYIIYGAGDRYVSAAKVNKKVLLEYLEKSDNSNPFVKSP